MTTTQPGPDPEKCSIYSRYPLDSNSDQIRLLTVHDGARHKPIQCSIHVVSLHEKPLYRALSYVWGDSNPKKEIFIDGQAFSVGPNLFDAIRGFRGGWPSWKVRDVVIWIDAICIDQENLSERNHQVAMMDKIYSKCVEVIVWLGDFDKHLSTSTESYNADIQYNPPATEPHAIGCQCLDAVWARSENVQWTSTPTKALTIAWSVIRKIEAASNCDDLQVCRLFRNAEEMSAFRFFTDYIHKNPWFTRTWVVQEAVLAPQTNIYIETWLMSLHILTGAARTFVYHGNRGCCYPSFKKYKNLEWTLLFNQLGYMRSHSHRAAGLDGLLNVRAFMIGKTASLDHDLLYGMLGMLRTQEQIIPRYDRPVEEAYTEFSRHYLQIPSSCDCAVVTLFAFTPLRARYPCLPSWAIDHTIFEDGYLDGIRTYAWALADYKHLQLRTSGSSHGLKFHENHLILSGRFIDSINTIGQVNMYRASTDDPDHSVIHTWRDVVLARKSAHEPYILPDGYNGKSYDWATAWLRTLCANRRLSGDENHVIQLTREEMAIIISDARRDPSNLLVLQHTPTLNRDLEAQMLIPTARPDLHRQVYYVLFSVCYRSRIFLTQNDYLGIGNIDIQCGDRIFLSARCGRPVILRPVDGSISKWGRTTYRIVSSSYLDGFMDGPEEGVEFPCEEVWVE